ncbi:pyridoxamine 5'-phosphate oxidase family protein [Streptomyces sp. NPDC004126]|uniref:pyridoxamine 5'-phosphate oxidase family protein n=1 Tax=Streptomyces sp. NPDC004126 TaxID=3390695 RepID=UPI003CFD48FF
MRPMTQEEREAFLAEPYVGILSVTAEPERAPLTTPIWYEYQPGGFVKVITAPGARKTRLIEEAGRFALCAQVAEVEDYRYVSVEGPVTGIRPTSEQERFDMAARYMGAAATDYVNATEESAADYVAIHMRPERWNTFDFRRLPD